MTSSVDPRIVELEARVEALESSLRRRSRELRALQAVLGARELAAMERIFAGSFPLSLDEASNPFELDTWRERPTLEKAEVRQALTDLWRIVAQGPHGD